MYILSVVDYSDRSSNISIFKSYRHLINYFDERFEDIEDYDLAHLEALKFVDNILEKGFYCEDYYEYKIIEVG